MVFYWRDFSDEEWNSTTVDDWYEFLINPPEGVIRVPNPAAAVHPKTSAGITDVTVEDGVYKFMGCSVVSVNVTIGFNGTPSSMSVTLVEDLERGDSFDEPTIPSIWSFSLPLGGVGAPIIYTTPPDLNPNGFNPTNVPFYFCGICTNWHKAEVDISGRLITINLSDTREVLSGVQCLLSGFALSQNIGVGAPRYTGVNNVIDVFGYFNDGLEADRNDYGMQWNQIMAALHAVRVTIHQMNFEFYFQGEAFVSAPTWYRIDEQIIDLIGLSQKVINDGGSDLITVARKINSTDAVVEIRAIRRVNNNPLTQTELQEFVDERHVIVETFNMGREYRNEPTSHIIVGGMRNANYIAWPSTYNSSIHLTDGKEDYNKFPPELPARLFGGKGTVRVDDSAGNAVTTTTPTITGISAGAIFPFWGFPPGNQTAPLIEPFLSLDHLGFDKDTDEFGELSRRLPICNVVNTLSDPGVDYNWTVRVRSHEQVFLPNDDSSDVRPWSRIKATASGNANYPTGYLTTQIRGLPLNTEILRASIAGQQTFFGIYALYYPSIAEDLGFRIPPYKDILSIQNNDSKPNLDSYNILPSFGFSKELTDILEGYSRDSASRIIKSTLDPNGSGVIRNNILLKFGTIIHQHVRQYALDHMGRKFIVCLPRSEIMHRIWDDLPVPTNPEKPTIEYVVDQRGYWEYVPVELDGLVGGTSSFFTVDEEDQIRRRFMYEDERFAAMALMKWKPEGNINFNSNGINRAMFQDLQVSEFRPNKISSSNPSGVCISCSITQFPKRPDLALVELPSTVYFDPTDGHIFLDKYNALYADDENLATKAGLIKYLWYFVKQDDDFRQALKEGAAKNSITFTAYATNVVSKWANNILALSNNGLTREASTEPIMDLHSVIIPLTSTWVSYGPWYATYAQAKGMCQVEIDESLVPWNFDRPIPPEPWYDNLDAAGFEKLARTIADLEYVDSASIVVVGLPEYGLGNALGYNSNLTGISVDFGIGGVKTTYNFATYTGKPGTYRKADYDDLSRARIDTRPELPDPENINIIKDMLGEKYGTNRFVR